MAATKQIDNEFYHDLGDRWYSAHDHPVALLRKESQIKTPWVSQRIGEHFAKFHSGPKYLLDVGCGAGFLCNEISLNPDLNLEITGVDLSEPSLAVARKFDRSKKVNYMAADAAKLPFADNSFDVVTCMDFLEHIDEPNVVIKEIARVLRPGGLFFFHTFNRNWLANLVIIRMVEVLVKNTPARMHVIDLFITPQEMNQYCLQSDLKIIEMVGIRPQFSTITWQSLLQRTVPEKFAFQLTPSLRLSYMGFARKI